MNARLITGNYVDCIIFRTEFPVWRILILHDEIIRILHNTPPEKQERAKEQIHKYDKEYFTITGEMYIPLIQRKKYEEGDY